VLDTAVPHGSSRPDASFRRATLDADGIVVDIGRARAGELGAGASDLDGLVVTLRESHIAWASYERRL
jgi:hypothetical protein